MAQMDQRANFGFRPISEIMRGYNQVIIFMAGYSHSHYLSLRRHLESIVSPFSTESKNSGAQWTCTRIEFVGRLIAVPFRSGHRASPPLDVGSARAAARVCFHQVNNFLRASKLFSFTRHILNDPVPSNENNQDLNVESQIGLTCPGPGYASPEVSRMPEIRIR